MTAELKKTIEEEIKQFPIAEYAFLSPEELPFSERVRYICKTSCVRYGKSWACPPAVGGVSECREKCLSYSECFLFTTLHEAADPQDTGESGAGKEEHEQITRRVRKIFEHHDLETLALSAESCSLCKECAYPKEKCRRPDEMLPCLESYGILVTGLADKYGMGFLYGSGVVRWFSLILARERSV